MREWTAPSLLLRKENSLSRDLRLLAIDYAAFNWSFALGTRREVRLSHLRCITACTAVSIAVST